MHAQPRRHASPKPAVLGTCKRAQPHRAQHVPAPGLHALYVRRLLVAVAMPRRSRNSPITVSRGTPLRSAAALVALLDAVAIPTSTCYQVSQAGGWVGASGVGLAGLAPGLTC